MSRRASLVLSRMLQVVAVFAALFAVFFLYAQYNETRAIDSYVDSNGLRPNQLSRENIREVVDHVRRDFNSDEETFKHLDMNSRPFLREDTRTLLSYKEGLCGEGTRVLVNLLNEVGYDATRITLYDKRLQSAHTLVSLLMNGQEFLVDSINSEAWLHELLDLASIASSDFDLLHYTDDHEVRAKFEHAAIERSLAEPTERFFRTYRLYSYEAIPYTKLLTTFGWDVRVFNFQRPNQAFSRLAEAPNLIYFLVLAGVSIGCFLISILLRRKA